MTYPLAIAYEHNPTRKAQDKTKIKVNIFVSFTIFKMRGIIVEGHMSSLIEQHIREKNYSNFNK